MFLDNNNINQRLRSVATGQTFFNPSKKSRFLVRESISLELLIDPHCFDFDPFVHSSSANKAGCCSKLQNNPTIR